MYSGKAENSASCVSYRCVKTYSIALLCSMHSIGDRYTTFVVYRSGTISHTNVVRPNVLVET